MHDVYMGDLSLHRFGMVKFRSAHTGHETQWHGEWNTTNTPGVTKVWFDYEGRDWCTGWVYLHGNVGVDYRGREIELRAFAIWRWSDNNPRKLVRVVLDDGEASLPDDEELDEQQTEVWLMDGVVIHAAW